MFEMGAIKMLGLIEESLLWRQEANWFHRIKLQRSVLLKKIEEMSFCLAAQVRK